MGVHYLNKVVLLDERDAGSQFLREADSFDEFAEDARDIAEDVWWQEEDFPVIRLMSIASERFGQVEIFDCDLNHGKLATSWDASLRTIAHDFGGLSGAPLDAFVKQGNTAVLREHAMHDLQTFIRNSEYALARQLLTTFEHLETIGLPGFAKGFPSIGGDDEALDCRDRDHGPGRRWMAEFAVILD